MTSRPLAATSPPSPPAELRDWVQHGCRAVGGSGQVFDASRGDEGAVVKWGRWRDAALRRRFEREARCLLRVGPPLVPRLLDRGVVDGWPYLVLERIDGHTLADHLADRGGEARRLGGEVAAAVGALHRAGVKHGDLKPENIFLTPGGVRLIDLGLAHLDEDVVLESGGTIHYAAPEQLQRGPCTPAIDVYALGVMLFELTTGRPPFVGERPAIEYGHLMCRPPRPSEVGPCPTELDALIVACLDKRPERRPALDDIIAVLASAGETTAVSSPAAGAPQRERGPVALLWIHTRERAMAARAIADSHGRVLRERADGTLAAFLWHEHERPTQVALAVGRRLALHASVVLHTASVLVRRSSARVTVHGPAVEHPESWRPSTPWTGLLITDATAGDLEEDLIDTDTPGFRRTGGDGRRARSQVATVPDLVARVGLVDELAGQLHDAARRREPMLTAIVGAAGSGKSRALEELRARLDPQLRVISVGGRAGHAGRAATGPALFAALGGVAGHSLPDRLRAAATAESGLIILVDDGHRVEDELLDQLELACGWDDARLAVVVASLPGLLDARPRWGERARSHQQIRLAPLDDQAAARLVRDSLAPARLVPEALVERIVGPARGNPGALVGAARALHRRGLVRRYPGSQEWYVAADEVDLAALAAGDRWTAARELGELPAGMAEFVTLCAALGAGFDLTEVEAVQHELPRGASIIEPCAGLDWLTRHGHARADGAGWSLTNPALHEAALAHGDPAYVAAIHAAAFAHWNRRDDRDDDDRLARLAEHGRGGGYPESAAVASLALAERARRRHAHVEAERMATLALDGAAGGVLRGRVLVERGRARFRLQRFEAACVDLMEAAALARERGDLALEIDAEVARAAVLDFTNRQPEAAAVVEAAAVLAAAGVPADVQARLDNWLGVARVRQHRFDEAIAMLCRAIRTADALGDHETAVGSMLMLASAHRQCDRLAVTLDVLGEVIMRCEVAADAFHLAIALLNRINAWREAGRFDAAELDCDRALALAELHGFGMMEVFGWFNRSELRFLEGAVERALVDGRQAYAIAKRRFLEEPPVYAALWLGVLEAGCGDPQRARELLDEAGPRPGDPMSQRMRSALALATDGDAAGASWPSLRAASNDPFDQQVYRWLEGAATATANHGR